MRLVPVLFVFAAIEAPVQSGPTEPPARFSVDEFAEQVLPILARHCHGCHGAEQRRAELDFSTLLTEEKASAVPALWSEVFERVSSREMPPPDAPSRPDAEERRIVLSWIASHFEVETTGPARSTARRLNRFEYGNAVLDLFGVHFPVEEHLPADDVGHGFDNLGDVLSLSPVLFERYFEAAERIATEALPLHGREGMRAQRVRARDWQTGKGNAYEERFDVVTLFSSGRVTHRVRIDEAGEYLLRIHAWGRQAGPEDARMELRVDDRALQRFEVGATSEAPGTYEIRTRLTAGSPEVGITFLNDYYEPSAPDPADRDRNLYLSELELFGPLDRPHRTAFEERWRPAGVELDEVVRELARHVWRRPVAAETLDALLATSAYETDERERLRTILIALVTSPRFLFRVEPDGQEAVRMLDPYELATRLAAFLWSSVPDEDLIARAASGGLQRAEELRDEVDRMLADARSSRLARSFAGQWLQLSRLEEVAPDPARFPGFDDDLLLAMRGEVELFFDSVLREGRPLGELLEADYTFANEDLGRIYGFAGLRGPELRRITVPPHLRGRRGGLIGMAAPLAATSYPTRSSPVLRGKFLLDALFATPPAPPPPGVGVLPEVTEGAEAASLRERLELHRQDEQCAACHASMDALGFALENYDPLGRWRERIGGLEVDTRAELADGRSVTGPADVRRLLLDEGAFVRSLVRHLFVFALGRALGPEDEATLEVLCSQVTPATPLVELVHAMIETEAFRTHAKERLP